MGVLVTTTKSPVGKGGGVTGAGPVTINVYALPGQSAQDIAKEVAKILGGGGGNGSYEDDGEGFD